MIIRAFYVAVATVITLCFVTISHAEQSDHGKHEHHEHHVHGEADLTLVIEGESLVIEFRSPAMNVLGFEGEAQTQKHRDRIKQANKQLISAGTLFTFGKANCQLTKADSNLAEQHDHAEGHHHGKKEHSDIEVQYRFKCKSSGKLTGVTTTLFETFQGLQKINAQWITDNGQGAATLKPSSSHIHIR